MDTNAVEEDMKRMAFISRHTPTADQYRLARDQGYTLIPVGDMDAFAVTYEQVEDAVGGKVDAVAVVHPAAALRLISMFSVGVFKNENRAPEGERQSFTATELTVYALIGETSLVSMWII